MLENSIGKLSEHLFEYLIGQPCNTKGLSLVKKHSENLKLHGELSFPNSPISWQQFISNELKPDETELLFLQIVNKRAEDIVEESKNWNLHVQYVQESPDRVFIHLSRPHAVSTGLSEARRNTVIITNQFQNKCSNNVQIDPLNEETDITSLRVKYVCRVIENLCVLCKCESRVVVTSKCFSKSSDPRTVLCGPVLNARTGAKETAISSAEFIRLRQNEMTLIAQHKYGVRVSTDSNWQEFIAHLGESAAAFELLQSKPSSPVKINFENVAAGSSKGASFILYNCARLETMLRTFNEKVADGMYPQLPPFEEVDFTLLTQEDEWQLIFNYILGFPHMLDKCSEVRDNCCEFRPQNICNFLCSMVKLFSQYYRKTRILVEGRQHLLPVIYARIYMLKILNDNLKTCLRILNIKSVSQM